MKTASTTLRLCLGALGLFLALSTTTPAHAAKRLVGITITNPARMCRTANVLVTRLKYLTPSWKTVMSAKSVTDLIGAVADLKAHACVSGGPTAAVYLDDMIAIGDAWRSGLTDVMKAGGVPAEIAQQLLGADIGYQLEQLAHACGTEPGAVHDYIMENKGSAAGSVIGAECSGKTAPQARADSQIFSGFAVKDVAKCVTEAGDSQHGCGAAFDEGDDDEPQPIPVPPPPPPMTESEMKAIEAQAGIETADKLNRWVDGIMATGVIIAGAGFIPGFPVNPISDALTAVGVGYGVGGAVAWLTAAGLRVYSEWLRDSNGGGQKMCPAFGLSSGPAFMSTTEGTPMSGMDVVQDCMCAALGIEAKKPSPFEDPMGMGHLTDFGFCADNSEKKKMDCLRNPYGPDDGIRKECAVYLKDKNGQKLNSDKLGELCNHIQCPTFRYWTATPKPDGGIACQCSAVSGIGGGGFGDKFLNKCFAVTCNDGSFPSLVGGTCTCATSGGSGGGIGGGNIDFCKLHGCN